MNKSEAISRAADHIRQTIPTSDISGRMVMAAFMQDSIDHEYGEEDGTERKEAGHS
jgi:hypothetical protein